MNIKYSNLFRSHRKKPLFLTKGEDKESANILPKQKIQNLMQILIQFCSSLIGYILTSLEDFCKVSSVF